MAVPVTTMRRIFDEELQCHWLALYDAAHLLECLNDPDITKEDVEVLATNFRLAVEHFVLAKLMAKAGEPMVEANCGHCGAFLGILAYGCRIQCPHCGEIGYVWSLEELNEV